jgi:hypothetical protein
MKVKRAADHIHAISDLQKLIENKKNQIFSDADREEDEEVKDALLQVHDYFGAILDPFKGALEMAVETMRRIAQKAEEKADESV